MSYPSHVPKKQLIDASVFQNPKREAPDIGFLTGSIGGLSRTAPRLEICSLSDPSWNAVCSLGGTLKDYLDDLDLLAALRLERQYALHHRMRRMFGIPLQDFILNRFGSDVLALVGPSYARLVFCHACAVQIGDGALVRQTAGLLLAVPQTLTVVLEAEKVPAIGKTPSTDLRPVTWRLLTA